MATEYGIRATDGTDYWEYIDRDYAESTAREYGFTLIAREVSEPRIVSIRA